MKRQLEKGAATRRFHGAVVLIFTLFLVIPPQVSAGATEPQPTVSSSSSKTKSTISVDDRVLDPLAKPVSVHSSDPKVLVLLPGGDTGRVVLKGTNLDRIIKAHVVKDNLPIRHFEVRLGLPETSSRLLKIKADKETPAGSDYVLRLSVRRNFIVIPGDVLTLSVPEKKIIAEAHPITGLGEKADTSETFGRIDKEKYTTLEDEISIVSPDLRPDLQVRNFSFTPETPYEGEEKRMEFDFYNAGPGDAELPVGMRLMQFSVDGEVRSEGLSVGRPTVLAAGENYPQKMRYSGVLQNLFPSAGSYRVRIEADAGGLVEEANEGNNILEEVVTILSDGSPDVVITEVRTNPEEPTVDTPFSFVITVMNQGDGTARFSLRDAAMSSDCFRYGPGTNVTIAGGETSPFTMSALPEMYVEGTRTCTFRVNSLNDTDPENNEFTFTYTVTDN